MSETTWENILDNARAKMSEPDNKDMLIGTLSQKLVEIVRYARRKNIDREMLVEEIERIVA